MSSAPNPLAQPPQAQQLYLLITQNYAADTGIAPLVRTISSTNGSGPSKGHHMKKFWLNWVRHGMPPRLQFGLQFGLALSATLGLTHLAQAQDFSRDRGQGEPSRFAHMRRAPAVHTNTWPAGVRKIADVAYGAGPSERMDVYLPTRASAQAAPVIFMVHGGAWRFGDKAADGVVQNKVARWVPQGFVVISVNYPMLPQSSVIQQAQAIASALASAQSQAEKWGASKDQFILMGHSAGAHLVALLNAQPALAQRLGARPWLGAVALDSAVLDATSLMQQRHLPLYDDAFGQDPAYWQTISPYQQVVREAPPFLLVCSSLRQDSCAQAQAMASHVHALGGQAQVLPQPQTHSAINMQLGLESDYTRAVESTMASWSPVIAKALGH